MENKPDEITSLNFDSDILPKMLDARKKRKGYASFFDWPDKPIKERGTVRDLLEAMEANGEQPDIVKLKSAQFDPPDCVGQKKNGELVGFEVTELVDQRTVEMNRKVRQDWKEWSPVELLAKLGEIILEKDSKTFHGGPYSKIILVIFTDEPLVRSADCDSILRGQILGKCRNITDCYLLLSYQPGLKFYPYFKLEVSQLV
jgi:hypothetical protein